MSARTAFFEGGYAPVAVVVLVTLVSAAALILESVQVAVEREEQLAAAAAPTTPSASTAGDKSDGPPDQVCTVGYDYVIRADEGTFSIAPTFDGINGVPESKDASRCPVVNANPSTNGVPVTVLWDRTVPERFCNAKGHPRPWQCRVRMCGMKTFGAPGDCRTLPRAIPVGEKIKRDEIGGAAVVQTYGTHRLGMPEENREIADEALIKINSNVSSPVLDSFVGDLDDVRELERDYSDAEQRLSNCVGCSEETLQNLANQRDELKAELDGERLRLEGLARSAASVTEGGIGTVRPSECLTSRCADDEIARRAADTGPGDGPSTFGRRPDYSVCAAGDATCRRLVDEAFARGEVYRPRTANPADPTARTPSSSGCSGLSAFFGMCSTSPYGASYGQGGNYCVISTNPVLVNGPWRPGCLNAPPSGYGGFGAQQCSPIQQIISGCPNPFNPYQQQCGGLLLALNKCPTGSYNPYNQQNPYNYPQPTCSIQANPTNVSAAGQPTTLQWQSQNAQYASLSNSGQVGPNGSMTVYPQGPATYSMNVVGYGNQQAQCQVQVTVGGQGGGSGSGSGQPTAQISCQPLTADVGMQVGISFACQNAAVSAGSGFSTGGALSGNATTTVTAAPFGQHSLTYGLTCSNQGVTHSAQCTVNVNKAAIVLVANPKTVASGKEANIGWVTSGMAACTISSPSSQAFTDANASSASVSGSAKTGALTQTSSFVLACTTVTGATKTATTTVTVN